VTRRSLIFLAATAAVVLLAAACRGGAAIGVGSMPGEPTPSSPQPRPTAGVSSTTTAPTGALVKPDRYTTAIQAAASRGLHVWLEADLAKRWLDGPQAFRTGVDRLAQLAALPGVAGIKIADELGYQDGFDDDPVRMRQFVRDAADALRQAAPGKLVLIDLIAPELGCGAWLPGAVPGALTCREKVRAKYPALRLEEIDKLVQSGDVDVIDLSTYLQSPSAYTTWGTSIEEAQAAALREAIRRGWSRGVTLQSRKALAEAGGSNDTAAEAAAVVALYVDIPRREGAEAVDIWTWRQTYQNQIVSLLGPQLAANPLWDQLRQRHDAGARLFTHFTPSSVHDSVDRDLDVLRLACTDVFVAAGLG
jgi:hypothetical protein